MNPLPHRSRASGSPSLSNAVSPTSSLRADNVSAPRTAIIEPNRAKAELLAYFCANSWGFEVVALEKNARDGIASVQATKPELILATLTSADVLPGELVAHLREACPPARLVLLTSQCTEYLLHALQSTDYHGLIYEPDESMAAIGAAIAQVRAGCRFVSARIKECQRALRLAPAAFPKLLSKREQEVLICIAHSFSDEEIAAQLGVTPGTALSHRRQLMSKLRIHSTPKLIRYCTEKGFNSVPPFSSAAANPV